MAKTLTILTVPDQRLRTRAAPVSSDVLAGLVRDGFIEDLVHTMHMSDGVGIAATQVGVPLQIMVVLEGRSIRVYGNPIVVSRSLRTDIDTEGCLSVPGKLGLVKRPRTCTLEAIDLEGKKVLRKAKGLIARIYQHEVDHLNGVLYIDRALKVVDLNDRGRAAF